MLDVARKAGVHVATVSRALRRRPGVSDAVRTRIEKIAAELGYRPNPLVSALIRTRRNPGRTRYHATLGLLIPDWPGGRSAFHQDHRGLIDGIRQRAVDFGYRVDEFEVGALPPDRPRLDAILQARNICGVIVPPLHSSHDEVLVDWRHFPAVAVGLSQRMDVPRVVHDFARAMNTAYGRCREAGCRRIGLVLPRRVSEKVEHRWLAAYLLCQFTDPEPAAAPAPLLLSEEADERAFQIWAETFRPDAIIGLPHFTPIRAWLKGIGVLVPKDLSLVSLDTQQLGHRFAGIDQSRGLLGSMAVELVVGIVERNDRTMMNRSTVLSVEGAWRNGPTLRPRQE